MTEIDKIFNYPKEVNLFGMTYEELQERYKGLKAIADKLDEAARDRYDYQYGVLCNHISQCFDEIQRREADTLRKSDPQTGNYTLHPISDAYEAMVAQEEKIAGDLGFLRSKICNFIEDQIKERILHFYKGRNIPKSIYDTKHYSVCLPLCIAYEELGTDGTQYYDIVEP